MKMVKSLLLGTAAGLVAMTGAQAADLPVKAKPVQYVKICSLYGAGFYYIPGTDTCIKVGGYVRVQAEAGANGGGTPDIVGGTQGGNNRTTNNYGYRTRGLLSADARSQTEYGTLRSYFNLQMEHNDGSAAQGTTTDVPNIDTAFIQLGGFTAGLANSFYNYLSFAGYGYSNNLFSGDSGAVGTPLLAYTAQLGGGLSASVSLEDTGHRLGGTLDAGAGGIAQATMATLTADNGGNRFPDVIGNLRIDQAWGSAQVMGAAHQVAPGYAGATFVTGPSQTTGYAVGGGIQVNLPMLGAGDLVAVQANYAKGAMRYVAGAGTFARKSNDSIGYGYSVDGVFSGTDMDLTSGYSINGVFQHNWNSKWKTSLYGGYVKIDYNDRANTNMCADIGITVANGCNNDWSFWQLGTRTAWAPVANLEVGLDILYTKLNTASRGATGAAMSVAATDAATANIADQSVWTGMLRIQRNFYP